MWHDTCVDVLRAFGFTPSYGEPEIWMRDKCYSYKYIACYVDDLAFAWKTQMRLLTICKMYENSSSKVWEG